MSAHNDNRIVQGLWVGGRLSALERLCVRSYCAHGHEFHLYHYDELHNVPRVDGLRLMNAEEILPRTAIFTHRKGRLIYFADQFRFELLRRRGGWWMDMDTVCLRPLDFADDVVLAGPDGGRHLWNWILKFPAGHPLTGAIADSYSDVDRIQPWDSAKTKFHKARRRLLFWRDSRRYVTAREAGGMISLMDAARHFNLEKHVQPMAVCSLPANKGEDRFFRDLGCAWDDFLPSMPELRVLHCVNSTLTKTGVNKDGDFPANSLVEILKRRHGEANK